MTIRSSLRWYRNLIYIMMHSSMWGQHREVRPKIRLVRVQVPYVVLRGNNEKSSTFFGAGNGHAPAKYPCTERIFTHRYEYSYPYPYPRTPVHSLL